MEYQVLARKCRPQNFEQVVGQEHVIKTLKNAISLNRIAHAYLFTGARGVGKTSIARIFAKALNCENGPTATPCDQCTSCKEITSGSSMDVVEIDGASNRKIDQIRDLREEVKFVPIAGKFKVYIIDEVHMLTQEAFNALLKTLEEPPHYIKFFFATTEPHKIPITILSRCQRFDLKFIDTQKIMKRLEKIAVDEKIEIEEKALYLVAKLAAGSMRDAESVFDKVIAFSDKAIAYDDILSVLGLVDQEMYFQLCETIIQKDIASGLTIINQIINTSSNLNQFIDGFMEYVRDLMMCVFLKEAACEVIQIPLDLLERVQKQSNCFLEEQLLYIIDILAKIKQEIKYALSPAVALEIGIIKIIKSNEIVSLKEIIAKLDSLGSESGSKVESSASKANCAHKIVDSPPLNTASIVVPPMSVGLPIASIESKESKWKLLLDKVQKEKPLLHSSLKEATVMKFEDNVLYLKIAKKFEFMISEVQISFLNDKAQEVISNKAKVSFQFEEDEVEKKKPKVDNNFLEDPLVKKTLKIFKNGQITEIRRNENG